MGLELLAVISKQSACKWLKQTQRYAATPGPHPVTQHHCSQPAPKYTAWWQKHIGVNNLAILTVYSRMDRSRNPLPPCQKSNALTIKLTITTRRTINTITLAIAKDFPGDLWGDKINMEYGHQNRCVHVLIPTRCFYHSNNLLLLPSWTLYSVHLLGTIQRYSLVWSNSTSSIQSVK